MAKRYNCSGLPEQNHNIFKWETGWSAQLLAQEIHYHHSKYDFAGSTGRLTHSDIFVQRWVYLQLIISAFGKSYGWLHGGKFD